MRIAVFGAGGVGGYFGGRLAEAGHSVVFLARGAHLEAIRSRGLRVESVAGDFSVSPAEAVERPEQAGPVDVVLVCVKAWQVPEAARAMAPLMARETFVVPLQNGVEAPEQLAEAIGSGRVVPGLCKIVSFIRAPGVIRHAGVDPWIAFGEDDGEPSGRAERLRRAFGQARGVSVEIPADVLAALWQKFLFIAPFSAVGAATRAPAGSLRSVPETRRLLETAMREVAALARARGVALPADAVERTMAFVDSLPPESTASMQRDIAEGRPSELDQQAGAVARLGREAGVPTPANDFLYAALLPSERRARVSA